MKRILAVFNIILILIFFIGTTAVYADITEEDISIVKNPDRGLYKLVQVELQNEEENFDDFEKKVDEINENDKEVSLILLELNLKNYVQENNISKNKIIEINKYFSIIRKNGYKVIVNEAAIGTMYKKNKNKYFKKLHEAGAEFV